MEDKFREVVLIEHRENIEALCQVFKANDFECWLVGGSVRDILMGKNPHDFDFASNAPLDDVKQMFKKVIPTGEDHGTLTVKMGDDFFEVTRFRRDIATDGRRATIEFADTIEEDLSRRDFTVNAIAFDPLEGKIVDPFDGMVDLENKRLRFVGRVQDRILEDHLRALRFIRFQVGEFGLEASDEDFGEVVEVFDESILSQERINEEIGKIFEKLGSSGSGFLAENLRLLGLFQRFFQGKDGVEIWAKAVDQMVAMRSLFPMAVHVARFNKSPKSITSRLKLPGDVKDRFQLFEKMADFDFSKRIEIKKFLNEISKTGIKDYNECFKMAVNLSVDKLSMKESIGEFGDNMLLLEKIVNAKEPFAISHLKVKGDDLIELGLEGPEIGKALQVALEAVWFWQNLNSGSFKANVTLWKIIIEKLDK